MSTQLAQPPAHPQPGPDDPPGIPPNDGSPQLAVAPAKHENKVERTLEDIAEGLGNAIGEAKFGE